MPDKRQYLNLEGILRGEDVTFSFDTQLMINTLQFHSFNTSSKPAPFAGTFKIYAYRAEYGPNAGDPDLLGSWEAKGVFSTILDILANGMGKDSDVTYVRNHDYDYARLTYIHHDGKIADLFVESHLGSSYNAPAIQMRQGDDNSYLWQITSSPIRTVNLLLQPYVFPVMMIYLKNTSATGNLRPVASEQGHVTSRFLLASVPVKPHEPISYNPDNVQEHVINEKKSEITVSFLWQNDKPYIPETGNFYLQLSYT